MRATAAALLCVAAAAAVPTVSAETTTAETVVARTKSPPSDYSLYQWTEVRPDDTSRFSFWAAEFHRGSLHRVETPMDRLVADCSAMTGTHLSLVTGETKSGRDVAETACGIDMANAGAPDYAGRLDSGYGALDIIKLRKDQLDRVYWISPAGLIIQSEFRKGSDANDWVLRNWAIRVEMTSPSEKMFSPDSLSASFVPIHIQAGPAAEYPPDFGRRP
jgi:hypothetical protein